MITTSIPVHLSLFESQNMFLILGNKSSVLLTGFGECFNKGVFYFYWLD